MKKLITAIISLGLMISFINSGSANYAPVISAVPHSAPPGRYRVQSGDTLYSIAWAYNLDFRTLEQINGISDSTDIQPGQLLIINPRYASKASSAAQAPRQRQQLQQPQQQSFRQPVRQPILPNVPLGPVDRWVWPARGKIIGYYAPAKGNKGINISAKRGTPIDAAAAGVVVYAGSGLRAYGKLLIIKHNSTYLSAYAHNETLLVKEGQVVAAGQEIAKMGKTGSERVELHFEIRRAGKAVNPLGYLPKAFPRA